MNFLYRLLAFLIPAASCLRGNEIPLVPVRQYLEVLSDDRQPKLVDFKFALVDQQGSTTYWSNDGTSTGGGEPVAPVALFTRFAAYSVLLGDVSLPNMIPVPPELGGKPDLFLRVWFKENTSEFNLVAPDRRIKIPATSEEAGGWRIVAPSPFPAASGQTGIWTGTEVIVWGGEDVSSATSVGGRYNPATNLWNPISLVDAPKFSIGSTAVWTGTEMLLWQPQDRTGSRYNPVLDQWSPMSTSGAPTIRRESSVVWTGTEMIIWGGSNMAQSVYENSGGRYDPVLNKWTAVGFSGGAPEPRSRQSAVWTGSEMIIWGGENASTAIRTGGRYNPAQNSWRPVAMAGAPPARIYKHPAAWTGSRLFLPGFTNTGSWNSSGATYAGGRYTPVENKWDTPITEGPTFHLYEGGVWTGKDMIMWGYSNGSRSPEAIIVRYNETSGTWVDISAGHPHYYWSPVWTGTQLIVRAIYNQQPVTFSYTPPRAAFRVTTVALEGGSVMLTFPSILGHRYTLWQSDSLAEGSWNPAGPASLPGTGSALSFTVPVNTSRQRFFRVQQAAP